MERIPEKPRSSRWHQLRVGDLGFRNGAGPKIASFRVSMMSYDVIEPLDCKETYMIFSDKPIFGRVFVVAMSLYTHFLFLTSTWLELVHDSGPKCLLALSGGNVPGVIDAHFQLIAVAVGRILFFDKGFLTFL